MPVAYASTIPGTDSNKIGPSQVAVESIVPVVSEVGKISMSIDGLGVYPESSGTIQVEKPAGAIVRKAYLAAATTGFTGFKLANGDITIDGVGVNWAIETYSSIMSWNYWAEVTSIVKSKIDAAPAGRVDFTIEELVSSYYVDGEILVVIFDDPNQTTDNTIVLLFGAQDIAGDTFAIGLAEPLDLSDPNLVLDMSLGISYSYQEGEYQYSLVEVNGIRMTTWAGGEDDGGHANGKLLTVGGLDDTNANPADPFATPIGDWRYDDELYNIKPFVQTGDTSISVYTRNPSMDDNIFFAALYLASTAAVVGEGIVLAPISASNPVGTQHTVTATVQDSLGNPIVDRPVTFTIESGPHAGMTYTEPTDNTGHASFTYTGTMTGTDVIIASFVGSQGQTITSNRVTKEWTGVLAVTIESCDATGAKQDTFLPGENVYVVGSGYSPSTTYDIYVVNDVTTWTNGMPIPPRVIGTEATVTSDVAGNIPVSLAWGAPLKIGKYDIVVDVNGNGVYDEDVDALDDSDIQVTAGFNVIPEYSLGTIMGLLACFAALAVFAKSKGYRLPLPSFGI